MLGRDSSLSILKRSCRDIGWAARTMVSKNDPDRKVRVPLEGE